jgi:hypothetical protein
MCLETYCRSVRHVMKMDPKELGMDSSLSILGPVTGSCERDDELK